MAYIGNQPTVGNFVKLDAIVTSATATYNLLNGGVAYTPASVLNMIVSLNGVIQEPTTASNVGGFTVSGSTIVFTSALTSADVIDFILVLGDVLNIGTPSDSTVTFPKVTSNLITGATAETTIDGGDSVLIYDDSASALRKMTRTNFVAGVGGTNTPAFKAYKTGGSQSISNNTSTKLTVYTTEEYDTDNAFASNTFTVPSGKGGKYVFTASISSDTNTANTSNQFNLTLKKNGSTEFATDSKLRPPYAQHQVTGTIDLIATDYVEVFFYQDSGASINIDGGIQVFFSGYKLIT